jgi:putative FmdB family regulatory protein
VPLYEYQCKKCRHRFEKIQKFSDRPVRKCPQCGGPVERLLSAPAVQFKGAGWYVTDYARKGAPSPESGGDAAKDRAGAGSKAGDKADTPEKADKKSDKKSEKPAKK